MTVSPLRRNRRAERVVAAVLVLAVLIGVLLVRTWVAYPVRVDSASMEPTFTAGDVVLVSRTPPTAQDVHRGDLVVFASPQDGRCTLKRVVGMPGDEVVILDGLLYVNDEPLDEAYVDRRQLKGYYSRTARVPADSVFVLGDNRGNSVDSRDYGSVSLDTLTGRVLLTVWPAFG